jgi:hypothetical protein
VHELPTAVSSEDEADSLQRAACSYPPAVARQDTVLVLVEVEKHDCSTGEQQALAKQSIGSATRLADMSWCRSRGRGQICLADVLLPNGDIFKRSVGRS